MGRVTLSWARAGWRMRSSVQARLDLAFREGERVLDDKLEACRTDDRLEACPTMASQASSMLAKKCSPSFRSCDTRLSAGPWCRVASRPFSVRGFQRRCNE